MTVLYVLLLYIVFVRFIANIKQFRNTKFELILMLIGIFIVLAFRDINSGTDTWNYIAEFLRIRRYDFNRLSYISTQEGGYVIFEWILGKIFPQSVQMLLIVQSIIVVVSIGYYIYRYCSKNFFLAVLGFMTFGLFGFHMTGIRQSLAMSICIWAYILFEKKRYILAFAIVALAISFHLSAFVAILYFVYGNLWKKYNNIWTTLIVGLIFAGSTTTILSKVSLFSERWNQYADVESTGNGWIFFIVLTIILLLGETLDKENEEYQFSKRINYVSFIFWTGRLVTRTMQRPAMYFFPANLPVLINGIEEYGHTKSRQLLRIGAFIGITLYYLYRFRGYTYHLISWF